MSKLAEIEKAIEALTPEEWWKIRRWMESREPNTSGSGERKPLPLVPSMGIAITQEQIDDALDAD
jgi:hypothetical protein